MLRACCSASLISGLSAQGTEAACVCVEQEWRMCTASYAAAPLRAPAVLLQDAPCIREYLDLFHSNVNTDLDGEKVWPVPPPLCI